MTPAASWSPADYYTASRAARRAWERTDSQLSLGLDDDPLTPPSRAACTDARHGAAGTGIIVEPDRLNPGAEPHRDTELTANQSVAVAPDHLPGCVGAFNTTTETTANHPQEARGRLQEGA